MWPGSSVLENVIYRYLGRMAGEPFCSLQSLFFLVPSNPGPSCALQLQRKLRKEGKDRLSWAPGHQHREKPELSHGFDVLLGE